MSYEDCKFLEIPRTVLSQTYKGVKLALQYAYSGIAALTCLIFRVRSHQLLIIWIVLAMIHITLQKVSSRTIEKNVLDQHFENFWNYVFQMLLDMTHQWGLDELRSWTKWGKQIPDSEVHHKLGDVTNRNICQIVISQSKFHLCKILKSAEIQ